jgi:hypothetical protein
MDGQAHEKGRRSLIIVRAELALSRLEVFTTRMAEANAEHRYMVDPSILLSEAGISWFEDHEDARSEVVVSDAFLGALGEYRESLFFPSLPDGERSAFALRRQRLLDLEQEWDIARFSSVGVELPDGEANSVLKALLNSDEPDAQILADEWTFLQSQSWMIAAGRAALDAFRRHGALSIEFSGPFSRNLAKRVVPEEHIPARLRGRFLARVGAKWVVWGGTTVGAAVGGALAGGALAGPIGAAVGGGGAGFIVKEVLQARLVAWDP